MDVTIDIWMPMAVLAGVNARILYSRGHRIGAWMVALTGPALLCLYAAAKSPSHTRAALLILAAWLVAAGLAAVCMYLFYYAAERLNSRRN